MTQEKDEKMRELELATYQVLQLQSKLHNYEKELKVILYTNPNSNPITFEEREVFGIDTSIEKSFSSSNLI